MQRGQKLRVVLRLASSSGNGVKTKSNRIFRAHVGCCLFMSCSSLMSVQRTIDNNITFYVYQAARDSSVASPK